MPGFFQIDDNPPAPVNCKVQERDRHLAGSEIDGTESKTVRLSFFSLDARRRVARLNHCLAVWLLQVMDIRLCLGAASPRHLCRRAKGMPAGTYEISSSTGCL